MEKLKAGILDGLQIRKLVQDQTFTSCMTVAERASWMVFICLSDSTVLGNTKASNYQNLVDVMLQNFQALNARMSKLHFTIFKLHYLFSHLDYKVPSRH